MGKRKRGDTIYYGDDLNVDLDNPTNFKHRYKLKENYKYSRNWFLKITDFLLYNLIAHPILSLVCIFKGIKVVNRKKIKEIKKKGYFVYQNHTNYYDVFLFPAFINWHKRTLILGYTDTLSIPVVKHLGKALGYIPIGDSLTNQKNMMNYMEERIKKGEKVIIFPEAHVWPYYTKIREFSSASFHYPAKFNSPIVPLVTVYLARKHFKKKKPKILIEVGDPIYPKEELSIKENKEYLRNECIKQMRDIQSKYNQDEYYNYVYKNE